ncbi:MAG: metal ABC transporter ATP-binding protein [Ignavibacteria bacterium]|nr:metal ABC transporter ATP-binding protein [Ignavibacteria bacterium]
MMEVCIRINNLTVEFGKYTVLKNINLSINDQEFLAIIGPNGGGKTTLIKAILGLIEPKEGNVLIFGKKPTELTFKDIGYVPQIKTLDRNFPAKVYELVATGLTGNWNFRYTKEMRREVREVLAFCGMEHLEHRPINKLSGGELQRVFLARSIIRRPRVLLLDEPATGIDTVAETDFSLLLETLQYQNQTTIVMVTHDWEYAFHHSTSVLLLNKSVVAFGSPKEVFSEENIQKTFGHFGHDHKMEFIIKKNV